MSHEGLGLKLVIDQESISAYPFIGEPFDVRVFLKHEKSDELYLGESCIPLNVKMCFDNPNEKYPATAEECPSSVVTLLDDNNNKLINGPFIYSNGEGKLRIVFNDLSLAHSNKKFLLLLSIGDGAEEQYLGFVKPVISKPLLCVSYKLAIEEQQEYPFTWFKDEGGRDKTIRLNVKLIDSKGQPATGRKVKLRAELCYYGGALVDKQSLVEFTTSSTWTINDDNGKRKDNDVAVICYRITQVSARHQAQPFTLKIVPDTSTNPSNADIAPAFSVPVEVRSKRNNNPSNSKRNNDPSTGKRSREGVKSYGGKGSASAVAAAAPASIGQLGAYPFNGMGGRVGAGIAAGMEVSKKLRAGSAADAGAAAAAMLQGLEGCSPETHMQAVNTVILWINDVVAGLQEIQWKPIGYAADDASGAATPGQPLYHIPMPVDRINALLESHPSVALHALIANASSIPSSSSASATAVGIDSVTGGCEHDRCSDSGSSFGAPMSRATSGHAPIRRDDSTGQYYGLAMPKGPAGGVDDDGSSNDEDDDDDFKHFASVFDGAARNNSLSMNPLLISSISTGVGINADMSLGQGVDSRSAVASVSTGGGGSSTTTVKYHPRAEGVSEKPNSLKYVLSRAYALRMLTEDSTNYDLNDLHSSSSSRDSRSADKAAGCVALTSSNRLECIADGAFCPPEALGCPAFDSAKQLVGFLRDDQDQSAVTVIKFIGVKEAGLRDAEVRFLETAVKAMPPGSERLFDAATYTFGSDRSGNIAAAQQEMVEAAMKCYWGHNIDSVPVPVTGHSGTGVVANLTADSAKAVVPNKGFGVDGRTGAALGSVGTESVIRGMSMSMSISSCRGANERLGVH